MTDAAVLQPDVVELIALYRWAAEHPDEHDQSWWAKRNRCGTAYCIAGQALVRHGEDLHWSRLSTDIEWATNTSVDGAIGMPISQRAQQILRLTDDQADWLFSEDISLDQIAEAVFEITGVDPDMPAVCGNPVDHEPHSGEHWPSFMVPADAQVGDSIVIDVERVYCTGIVRHLQQEEQK